MLMVMTINAWWAGDPAERYWMEITDRDDPGVNLRAPQTNASGREEWSYALVTYTQPGDVVFHWHKHLAGEPALVGWSEVTGPLSESSMDWLAHGSRGRARGRVEHVADWVQELGGMHPLARPLTKSVLTANRRPILTVIEELKTQTPGPVYQPFFEYGGRELRAMQSYLTKMPAALVAVLRDLGLDLPPATKGPRAPQRPARRGTSQGRQADPELRRATERHAVEEAVRHYRKLGATDIRELGKPYDLDMHLNGAPLHVEVKGTTADAAVAVVLTANEVTHARAHPTELFVLDGITYQANGDGTYTTNGGRARVWPEWQPDLNALTPTEYRYELPS